MQLLNWLRNLTNLLRLLSLPEKVKIMIREGKLTEGHARAILALDNEADILNLAEKIVSDSLSVRDVEGKARFKRKRRQLPERKTPELADAETFLRQLMGTSVKIHHGLKRGKIEIEYYSDDDLDRLLELFRRIPS